MTTDSLQSASNLAACDGPADAPVQVIALLARRPGDNAQIETLATASGLPWRSVRLGMRKGFETLPNLRRGGSLFSYDRATQEALRDVSPDVVIAAGKRSAPAALWLKAWTGARLVHLGRTWAPAEWFDHVITTPQYRQPRHANVVENRFPLTAALDRSGALDPDLEALPRPRVLAVVGGSASPQILDASAARAFIGTAVDRAQRLGGSLLVATSPRTSRQAVDEICQTLRTTGAPWRLTIFGKGHNHYCAFLIAADRLIVTNDSVSMVAEAASTGRPVELFTLPTKTHALSAPIGFAAARGTALGSVADRLVDVGLVASGRDLELYMAGLAGSGLLDGGTAAAARMATELSAASMMVKRLAITGHASPSRQTNSHGALNMRTFRTLNPRSHD